MADATPTPHTHRADAARLAFALIRFEEAIACEPTHSTPAGTPRLWHDAYSFAPSWQLVARSEVEQFLIDLPSPALLMQTTTKGMIALLLLDEMEGDRHRWAEKTLTNATGNFDHRSAQVGLTPDSRILLEFDEESLVFSASAVRLWTQQFAVNVGWNMQRLDNDPRAEAQLMVRRTDGRWARGVLTSTPVSHTIALVIVWFSL